MQEAARNFQLILLVAFLIPAIFFLLCQYRTLEAIHPGNRKMAPVMVWLQCIPILGLIWQFIVITRISDSIRNELNAPVGDSIFADDPVPSDVRPTYSAGLLYAICFCISVIPIPLLKTLAALVGMVLWIVYWSQLVQYKKKVKDRSMGLNLL